VPHTAPAPPAPPAGSYQSAYAANLAAGLDDSDGPGPSGRGRGGSGSLASRRSASLHLKGLPLDREEGDIYRLLQGFEGIRSVRVLRDKVTGASRGLAFVVGGCARLGLGPVRVLRAALLLAGPLHAPVQGRSPGASRRAPARLSCRRSQGRCCCSPTPRTPPRPAPPVPPPRCAARRTLSRPRLLPR
jgi:hypothetical protein